MRYFSQLRKSPNSVRPLPFFPFEIKKKCANICSKVGSISKMDKKDWRDSLRACFESTGIIEGCQSETSQNFTQFCEFIAEPAFEALADELKAYGIKVKYGIERGKSITIRLPSPQSKADNFEYTIVLPKNSVDLKLSLRIKEKKTPKGPWEEREEPFMERVLPSKVMKITKEELLEDIIEHYKNFTYRALTAPD
jgi:hypothetical protein